MEYTFYWNIQLHARLQEKMQQDRRLKVATQSLQGAMAHAPVLENCSKMIDSKGYYYDDDHAHS
jgi:hypothetical protein